jgi:hypothetical protein
MWATMPETSVHKDRDPRSREADVWAAREPPHVGPVPPYIGRPERVSKNQLRGGVPPLVRAHHARSNLGNRDRGPTIPDVRASILVQTLASRTGWGTQALPHRPLRGRVLAATLSRRILLLPVTHHFNIGHTPQ